MTEKLIIEGTISLLAALIGTLIALKIQHHTLAKTHIEQQAWERAQEGRQRNWEVNQEKHTIDLENALTLQVQQIQAEWQTWQTKDSARLEELSQKFIATAAQLNLEKDLARIPRIEETPLPSAARGHHRHSMAGWQPPSFYKRNLSRRDLSRRYLERVDLREAQLAGTSFYMANLSGACLAGANLSGANLSGADLSGADLRYATLNGANLLVTDLHNTILIGANLLGARNLTTKQVYSAIYDSTTQLDPEIDLTLPRVVETHGLAPSTINHHEDVQRAGTMHPLHTT